MEEKPVEAHRGKRKLRSDEDEKWDCSVCTYMNSSEAFRCEICHTRKGTSTSLPPRLENVDRSSPLLFEVFANGYSVVITEFRPKLSKKKAPSIPDSPAPSNCSSSIQGLTSTPLGTASDQLSPAEVNGLRNPDGNAGDDEADDEEVEDHADSLDSKETVMKPQLLVSNGASANNHGHSQHNSHLRQQQNNNNADLSPYHDGGGDVKGIKARLKLQQVNLSFADESLPRHTARRNTMSNGARCRSSSRSSATTTTITSTKTAPVGDQPGRSRRRRGSNISTSSSPMKDGVANTAGKKKRPRREAAELGASTAATGQPSDHRLRLRTTASVSGHGLASSSAPSTSSVSTGTSESDDLAGGGTGDGVDCGTTVGADAVSGDDDQGTDLKRSHSSLADFKVRHSHERRRRRRIRKSLFTREHKHAAKHGGGRPRRSSTSLPPGSGSGLDPSPSLAAPTQPDAIKVAGKLHTRPYQKPGPKPGQHALISPVTPTFRLRLPRRRSKERETELTSSGLPIPTLVTDVEAPTSDERKRCHMTVITVDKPSNKSPPPTQSREPKVNPLLIVTDATNSHKLVSVSPSTPKRNLSKRSDDGWMKTAVRSTDGEVGQSAASPGRFVGVSTPCTSRPDAESRLAGLQRADRTDAISPVRIDGQSLSDTGGCGGAGGNLSILTVSNCSSMRPSQVRLSTDSKNTTAMTDSSGAATLEILPC